MEPMILCMQSIFRRRERTDHCYTGRRWLYRNSEVYFVQDNRWKYYVNGLGTTLIVSLLSVLIGVILGLLVAIIRINAEHRGKGQLLRLLRPFMWM